MGRIYIKAEIVLSKKILIKQFLITVSLRVKLNIDEYIVNTFTGCRIF